MKHLTLLPAAIIFVALAGLATAISTPICYRGCVSFSEVAYGAVSDSSLDKKLPKDMMKVVVNYETSFRMLEKYNKVGRLTPIQQNGIDKANSSIDKAESEIRTWDGAFKKAAIEYLAANELKRTVQLGKSNALPGVKQNLQTYILAQRKTLTALLSIYFDDAKEICDGLLQNSNIKPDFKTYEYDYSFSDSRTISDQKDIDSFLNYIILDYEYGNFHYSKKDNNWQLVKLDSPLKYMPVLVSSLFDSNILEKMNSIREKFDTNNVRFSFNGFGVEYDEDKIRIKLSHAVGIPYEHINTTSNDGYTAGSAGRGEVFSSLIKGAGGRWEIVGHSVVITQNPSWIESRMCTNCNGVGYHIETKAAVVKGAEGFEEIIMSSGEPLRIRHECAYCSGGSKITEHEENSNSHMSKLISLFRIP